MQDSLVIVTPSHHVYIKRISALGVFDGKNWLRVTSIHVDVTPLRNDRLSYYKQLKNVAV